MLTSYYHPLKTCSEFEQTEISVLSIEIASRPIFPQKKRLIEVVYRKDSFSIETAV